ncbi:MAG: choice-of-anchor J domain-containing protein [Bacteroidota bacterium]
MRKINLLILCLVCRLISGVAAAQVLLTEGFETGAFPPTGWTRINAGTGNNWQRSDATFTDGPYTARTGARAMIYEYSGASAANTWMMTPAQAMVASKTYTISFYYRIRSSAYVEKMKVTVGTAPTVAAQTTIKWDNNGAAGITNTVYTKGSFSYTPPADGNYYFGFNCYSIADQWAMQVDDIVIEEQTTPPPLCTTNTAPVDNATGVTSVKTGVQLTWNAAATATSYDIYLSTTNPPTTSLGNLPGATTVPITGLNYGTKYYWYVAPQNAGGTASGCVSSTTSFTTEDAPQNCASVYLTGCTLGDSIKNVKLAGTTAAQNLDNTSGCGSGGYQDYYATQTGLPDLSSGLSYNGSVTTGDPDDYITIWIDFNNDGYFTVAERLVSNLPVAGANVATPFTLNIPPGSALGNHRMRIRAVWFISPPTAPIDPCNPYRYGETEDYKVNIIAPPACAAVTGLTVSTRTPAFMELNWNASAGTTGYEYVVDELAADPVGAGTAELGNSMVLAFGTYDPDKIYYVHVRSNCGASGYSAWVKYASVPCVTNLSPIPGATGVSIAPTFNWTPVGGAAKYGIYISANSGTNYVGPFIVTAPPAPFTGFAYNTTYKWFVRAINGSDSSAFACEATNGTSFTTELPPPPPANDACAGAVNLTVSNGFCEMPALGTLISADSTTGLGTASCASLGLKYDVWYKATVPATGKLTVQTSPVNGLVEDLVLQAYSGACGSLVPIGCDDDGNSLPGGAAFGIHSKLGLTGRTPGEVIYYRVMAYDEASRGAFAICAYDTTSSVMPAVSAGAPNGCITANTVVIDSAWKYAWVTLRDVSGNVIGQIYPNGSKLGSTTASVYVNNGPVRKDVNNLYYLDRNLTITPQTQPLGQVITRMFFTAAELTALGSVTGGATRAQLNSSKTQQTCATSAIAADGTLISQFGSAAYGTNHQVDIVNTSYSTFYFHKGNIALPVNYAELSGIRNGGKVDLSWITRSEINNKSFEIERSADGRGFASVGIVYSKAPGGNSTLPISYSFADLQPLIISNYYRIKQTDIDGKVTYSNTVFVKGLKASVFSLNTIFPNPARERITAALQSPFADNITLVVTDMAGKVIKRQVANMAVGDNNVSVDVASLPAGSYLLKAVCNNGCETAVRKFTKQ